MELTARKAAERTFGQRPVLGLEESPSDHGIIADQHRLPGAFLVHIARIRPDTRPLRQRQFDAEQVELTRSVSELGLLQPITVRLLPDGEG